MVVTKLTKKERRRRLYSLYPCHVEVMSREGDLIIAIIHRSLLEKHKNPNYMTLQPRSESAYIYHRNSHRRLLYFCCSPSVLFPPPNALPIYPPAPFRPDPTELATLFPPSAAPPTALLAASPPGIDDGT